MERILGETVGTGDHLGDRLETYCNGNIQESTGMNSDRTPSTGGYGALTGHLLQVGKTSCGNTGTPNQPYNLPLKICPSYKKCWGKGGTESGETENCVTGST